MKLRQQGFTLIELAIVMLVLTILAAGILVPLTSSIEMKRYEATQKTLQEAREALIGYAMSHKDGASGRPYLPCPDKTTAFGIASNLPNDGIEDRVTTPGPCETPEGNFPWSTLGVGNADAWGNRLRYHVVVEFSQSNAGFDSSTQASLANQIQVCDANGTNCTPLMAPTTPPAPPAPPVYAAVIVSHGANGWGAMNSGGTAQAPPVGADEVENSNNDGKFVSRAPTQATDTTTEFDDVLVWLPQALLVSRVCFTADCT
ncbi:MAG: type II secretion system protein [Thiobacillaceae bacterium]